MSAKRQELQESLSRYVSETLTHITAAREFCGRFPEWKTLRQLEAATLMDINHRFRQIHLNLSHVKNSAQKAKAFSEYVKSKFQLTAEEKSCALEAELADQLSGSVEALRELDRFLDAVEKLAVTSPHVFVYNTVLFLPDGFSFAQVQRAIAAARRVCPLLLAFRRDAKAYFLPKLQNAQVLAYQLQQYTDTSSRIVSEAGASFSTAETDAERAAPPPATRLSTKYVLRMLDHMTRLHELRADEAFRTAFLFQRVPCSGFIQELNERQPQMLVFLHELEQEAVQLDRVSRGAKISNVAGGSVGAVGGVLSIVGLALIPVTAGVSLTLTMAGLGIGVTSAVGGVVTTATEIGVNHTHQKRAHELFQSFMEDVQSVQKCLDDVINQEPKEAVQAADNASQQGREALRSLPRAASELPDVAQTAVKGTVALSSGGRGLFIAANALFLGLDLFHITRDSMSLARGAEAKVSQLIRARAALWATELEAWDRICDCLCQSKLSRQEQSETLAQTFYPASVSPTAELLTALGSP